MRRTTMYISSRCDSVTSQMLLHMELFENRSLGTDTTTCEVTLRWFMIV